MRAVNEFITKMMYITPNRGLAYGTSLDSNGVPSHNVEHLSCFFPGLLTLGVNQLPASIFANASSTFTQEQSKRLSSYNMTELHMWAALGFGETCWQLYAEQPTELGPEWVRMNGGSLWLDAVDKWHAGGAQGSVPGLSQKSSVSASGNREYTVTNGYYVLRPEVCRHLSPDTTSLDEPFTDSRIYVSALEDYRR